MRRLVAAAMIVLGLGMVGLVQGAGEQFDVKGLVGSWEGEGTFLMPVTDVEVDIEGKGEFVYDARRQLVKTSMSGSKFFVSYADSGLLKHHPKTDSVSWEVWDNWGKHAMYWGEIRDGRLVADRVFKSKDYQVTVDLPHIDTLVFRLTVTDPKTKEKATRARFRLWRVK